MASIFDSDPNDLPPREKDEDEPKKRGKGRTPLSPAEYAKGKRTLYEMVEVAFKTLLDAMQHGDYNVAAKAAQTVLDRTGFGPKSTVDINTVNVDLTSLSRDELASRAEQIAQQIRTKSSQKEEKSVVH